MKTDSKNALRPDKLIQADARILHVRRLVQFCTNPDKITRAALDHPITMNGVIISCMDSSDRALDKLAYLLLINRVLQRTISAKMLRLQRVRVAMWWKSFFEARGIA